MASKMLVNRERESFSSFHKPCSFQQRHQQKKGQHPVVLNDGLGRRTGIVSFDNLFYDKITQFIIPGS